MARPHDAPQPISKAELLLRLDPLPEQIVVWDERGRLLQCNAGFARAQGEFMSPAQKALSGAADAQVRALGQPIDLSPGQPYRRADGEHYFHLTMAPFLLPDGRTGVLAGATDITERRQYEQDLQRMNEQLEARVQDRTRDLRHANRAPQPARAAANAAKSLFLASLQDCLARWLPAPAGHALRQAGGT